MNKQCLGSILLLLLCCLFPFWAKAQPDSTRMLPGVELNNSAFACGSAMVCKGIIL